MKKMISIITIILAISLLAPQAGSANVGINEKFGVPIVVYGGNLSDAEKESVAGSLNVAEEAEVEEIEVTGEDLITYIKDGDPRARMYSSAKITRKEAGEGLVIQIVTPDNITQVTSEMYANAMLTAGIEDATVEVAAPKAVTGHSALVGIYKAYEVNGEQLDPERTDVANDELEVATELADKGVEDEKVSELLTEIKKQIAEQNPATREEVEAIVEEQLSKLQIELSPEDRQLLVDLMDRIRKLDIDFSQWSTQLEDLSKTIEDKIGTVVNDDGFWQSVKDFFNKLIDGIRGLVS
ncbi:uncharacterized protein YpuA (DUF1002 family) [Planomicrobium koreense]|jgi:uncharacterized protein YpuA (DUF1002 family)|uniref:Uncharacterized protein YpuA (DUF1002 family) n=3 Tax=Planococcus koreensis TaxID=112331 RepID=A0A7W8CUR1_9BACL|nr:MULTISPECIES: DUF1002 domain-containing protein [Planococcus]MBB5181666.1 uncharacterized protein YpuA (DUF1002 family) [Planococcus koreensis]MDN3451641.1 DUF1002 domain-containing protein [Planococcus sp. APC 3906]